jgi:serine phosphatase RsbU (regulator of sigma subunit)/DNA-binding response OmpR family regulator
VTASNGSPRILVVDDSVEGRAGLRLVLERAGFSVIEGDTIASGEAQARDADLVLLDVNLPDGNGLELARRIRAAADTAATPILQVSATHVSPAAQARGLEGAADAYLVHPIDPAVLVATVRTLLAARAAERAAREANALLAAETARLVALQLVTEHARADAELLNRIGLALDGADTYQGRAQALVSALVPGFAGFAVVERLDHHDRAKHVASSGDDMRAESGAWGAISAPLRTRGRTTAVLAVGAAGGHRFDDGDEQLLGQIAGRAALSLENAALYEREHEIARTLQQSLLPEVLPETGELEFAAIFMPLGEGNEVGGDFYDVFETPHGYAAVVGDVCGKGAVAARLTSLCRYTVRAAAMRERDGIPSRILGRLNDAMVTQVGNGEFATVTYARLAPVGDGEFVARIATGGHPAPQIVRRDGHVEAAPVRGTVLGVVPHLELEDVDVTLHAGDALVFVSDGVTEARDPTGGLFGDARLLQALAEAARHRFTASELATRLFDELGVFRAGAPLRDDLVILVARSTGDH